MGEMNRHYGISSFQFKVHFSLPDGVLELRGHSGHFYGEILLKGGDFEEEVINTFCAGRCVAMCLSSTGGAGIANRSAHSEGFHGVDTTFNRGQRGCYLELVVLQDW